MKSIQDTAVGNEQIAFRYPDMILLVNLLDLSMRWQSVSNCLALSWRIPDKQLSVRVGKEMLILNTDSFKEIDKVKCLTSRIEGLSALRGTPALFQNMFHALSPYVNADVFNYQNYFIDNHDKESFMKNDHSRGTILEKAPDGSYVIVFEKEDAAFICNNQDEIICYIDKMDLTVMNGIQKLQFSSDSKLLLLWRNYTIRCIEINTGKVRVNLKVNRYHLANVSFADNCSLICLSFIDREQVVIDPYSPKSFMKRELKTIKRYEYPVVGPYTACDFEGNLFPVRLLDFDQLEFLDTFTTNSLRNQRVFNHDGMFLEWNKGKFFLNGDEKHPISDEGYDFGKCKSIEKAKDASLLDSFLREKSDVMSSLYEGEKPNFMILVLRSLNSVILFDIAEMRVVSVYKHPYTIIGSRYLGHYDVEIFSSHAPYNFHVRFTLSDYGK